MKRIDRHAYEQSIEKLSQIYRDIAAHAQQQSLQRCPYKNKWDQCTARFGCRYQRRDGDDVLCLSSDQLDYRTAWELDPGGVPLEDAEDHHT